MNFFEDMMKSLHEAVEMEHGYTFDEVDDYILKVNSQDNYIAKVNSVPIPKHKEWHEDDNFEIPEYIKNMSREELAVAIDNLYRELKGEHKMSTKAIKIKYFTNKIEKLQYIDGKSDWIDLRAADDISMKKGEHKLIPLGIAMQLPEGYEAHIVPRSSTFKNFGIIQTNHMGVVDETYCGDNDQWFMSAYALRDTEIKTNDRICQFRIMEHQPAIDFVEVECLNNEDRGGHGSTGKQ